MKRVLLGVDKVGDVVEVTDHATGEVLAFDVIPLSSASAELSPAVCTTYMPARADPLVRRALNSAVGAGGAARCIPLPHASYDNRQLRGCVHLLQSDAQPRESGWPLDLRYATGVTIVELEHRVASGAYLSPEFFRSEECRARFDAAVRELRMPRGTPPGLFNAGQPALEAFRSLTSEAFPRDPLLRMYRAKYLDTWSPELGASDFIRVCYSNWENVNPRTAASFGHNTHDTHYYLALCYHLPPELADQLLQLVRLNPEKQTWAQLAARKEFRRAEEISRAARESLIRRFMAAMSLEPKQSDRRFIHTTCDVLVPDAGAGGVVAFYSGCAPCHQEQGGVVSLTESDPDAPIFWWHGAYTPDNPGGEPFEVPGTANAMPVLGTKLAWKRGTIDLLADAGHRIDNGYVKLTPL